jgi:hypothetical protein
MRNDGGVERLWLLAIGYWLLAMAKMINDK